MVKHTTRANRRRTKMKGSKENKPLVSIITVVYNSEKHIEKTIQSIVSQTYPNIEYIIIDGGSTDNTVNIIKKYETKIACWISEKDRGLYDAMNKGMAKSGGDYLWFINSGDEIYHNTTLEKVFDNPDKAKIYYGETMIISPDGKEIGMRRHKTPKQLWWKSLKYGMKVSHQAFIVQRNICPQYNLKYQYSSDFEWVIKVLKQAAPTYSEAGQAICNTALVISKFMDGGRTKQTILPGLYERFKIMCRYYGFVSTFFRHFIITFRFIRFYSKYKRF